MFGYRKPSDLPATAALFPLSGAILFPRGQLPLNVFEPRYLNMVDDALASDRIIGMIQPLSEGGTPGRPALAGVGTLGRITSFAETEDGRYLITLTGVSRFRVTQELETTTPYRRASVTYDWFASDLYPPERGLNIDRERLRLALQAFVDQHGYEADWDAVDAAEPEMLVHAIAALCPFDPAAKQALLESETIADRCAALIALLEMGVDNDDLSGRRMQ
ncbi:MAG: peptidase S16 [Alphaproteobacteria bacterium]|nr:peptidase S16 [Alphaproteobacteria bacterium]